MNSKKWVGMSLVSMLLAGCASLPKATAESARNYDFDALNVYMSDSEVPARTVSSHLPEPKGFYGHWVAKLDLKEQMEKEKANRKPDPNVDPEMQKMGDEFAEAMAGAFESMLTFELDINEDGNFKMLMMGMPMEGKWTQTSNQLSLVPEKFLGMSSEEFAKKSGKPAPENKPLILQISPDGQSLIGQEPDSKEPMILEFKRQSA